MTMKMEATERYLRRKPTAGIHLSNKYEPRVYACTNVEEGEFSLVTVMGISSTFR